MAFEHYIRSGQKLLRCGFTTGTCAALAARGAAQLLLTGHAPDTLALRTPKGLMVEIRPRFCEQTGPETARCGVEKDAGDDPDVTDGLVIEAAVELRKEPGLILQGGPGVGRVTRPGLDQPVGEAAINSVPRRMIREQLQDLAVRTGYPGGFAVTISVPGGEEAAGRTFNPHLGIEGGISILGTSGIVEPMSERALMDTLELELKQAVQPSGRLILTPGNYGMDFLQARSWDRMGVPVVKCSNFLGDALDICASLGFREVLLVGHIGKLIKVAGGIWNTHSRYADCRTELFCAHAAIQGASPDLCRSLMESATTDACLELLEQAGLRAPVMESILLAIQGHLNRRFRQEVPDRIIGAVLFSNQYGPLGETESAGRLLSRWMTPDS